MALIFDKRAKQNKKQKTDTKESEMNWILLVIIFLAGLAYAERERLERMLAPTVIKAHDKVGEKIGLYIIIALYSMSALWGIGFKSYHWLLWFALAVSATTIMVRQINSGEFGALYLRGDLKKIFKEGWLFILPPWYELRIGTLVEEVVEIDVNLFTTEEEGDPIPLNVKGLITYRPDLEERSEGPSLADRAELMLRMPIAKMTERVKAFSGRTVQAALVGKSFKQVVEAQGDLEKTLSDLAKGEFKQYGYDGTGFEISELNSPLSQIALDEKSAKATLRITKQTMDVVRGTKWPEAIAMIGSGAINVLRIQQDRGKQKKADAKSEPAGPSLSKEQVLEEILRLYKGITK